MNWVNELIEAGEVERTKRGHYQLKDASATVVPFDAIGDAA
jgi:hypothetical protein